MCRTIAEGAFQGGGIQGLQQIAQRVQRRSPLQRHAEIAVQQIEALIQEGDDAPVRLRPTQHREQQQIRQRIALALGAPRIGNLSQCREQSEKRDYGNLSAVETARYRFRLPRSLVDSFYARYPAFRLAPRTDR